MKTITTGVVLLLLGIQIHAAGLHLQHSDSLGKVKAGFSAGINNPYGTLGIKSVIRLHQNFSAIFGLGAGFWGAKGLVAVSYHYSDYNGWSICAGYSAASGISGYKGKYEITGHNGSTQKKEVVFDFEPIGTLNLTGIRNIVLQNGKMISIETGYAFALKNTAFKTTNGEQLTRKSASDIKLLQPGGFIISISYCFIVN